MKKNNKIKASCGGQGCAVQPYILPYCEIRKNSFTKKA
jgi:hypothetical protein